MLTILNGTNRPENLTKVFSQHYYNYLKSKGIEVQYFTLEDLPEDFLKQEMYGKRSTAFEKLIDNYINQADKFVFFLPEYNGSYAGIMKVFMDALHPKLFRGKKASVIGIADGRAGNLLGIDHFTVVLNHVGVTTTPQRLPISKISDLVKEKHLIDHATAKMLEEHADRFLGF